MVAASGDAATGPVWEEAEEAPSSMQKTLVDRSLARAMADTDLGARCRDVSI